jgi:chaperonin GroES
VRPGFKTRISHPSAQPQASIDTSSSHRPDLGGDINALTGVKTDNDDDVESQSETPEHLIRLFKFAKTQGDISDLIDESVVNRIGIDAVRQWEIDKSSRDHWLEQAQRSLAIAAQENDSEDDGEKTYPFDGAANIHYPILTVACQQFAARALPALLHGDKVIGVKVFDPPAIQPSVTDQAKAGLQPTDSQQATEDSVKLAAAQNQEQQQALQDQAKAARAERVKHYLNWIIFYKMKNWEGETDALLHEVPVVGAGFKKVYRDAEGFQSDYVSSTRLTVNNNTKSIYRCPRITEDFDAYPYEIEQKQRLKEYRDIDIPVMGEDPENPVELISQYRLEDLDDDGLQEPYIVTVHTQTRQVLRIEPAYTLDDITIDEIEQTVKRIDRWLGYSEFFFLPDPKGRYYGIGFGRLLEAICDSIDTSINQLIDAGNAEIAGGGFIASGVRLQGSGQGGTLYQRPGEYQTVSAQGMDLKQAIWERTLPHPSQITYNLLELLLNAAKDISSVKDVITGNTPATAPVGTTLALQDQALQVFSAIYQRMYRGFHHEFQLLYKAIKRWATDKDKLEYQELTGGDLEADFAGDGTDIQPIADPAVVTKQQKIARIQTLIQLAESAVGMAAGMTQAGPSQEIAKEALNAMEWDRPERFLAAVPPNQELIAKVAEMQASAQEKAAKAQTYGAGAQLDQAKVGTEQALAALHASKAGTEGSVAEAHQARAATENAMAEKHKVDTLAKATETLDMLHKIHRHIVGLPEENPTHDELGKLPGTSPQIEELKEAKKENKSE